MLDKKITCLILSCDQYSDLWDGNVTLFNRNWPQRPFETYLVTDKPSTLSLSGVKIMVAGFSEWSERLAYALHLVETEYVFITLDDYFLIRPVDNNHMEGIIELMDKRGYDYMRFYPRPKSATRHKISGSLNLYEVDTMCGYSVNLYSSIWKTDFLQYCVRDPLSAWQFEVALSDLATDYHAKCMCSNGNDFEILDVVRKGKILHKADRYFKKNPDIYSGDRPVHTWGYELKLWVVTMIGRYAPAFIRPLLQGIYVRCGGISYQYLDRKKKKRMEGSMEK